MISTRRVCWGLTAMLKMLRPTTSNAKTARKLDESLEIAVAGIIGTDGEDEVRDVVAGFLEG